MKQVGEIFMSDKVYEVVKELSLQEQADLCVKCGVGCWVIQRSMEVMEGNRASYVDLVEESGAQRMGEDCANPKIKKIANKLTYA